MREIKFRAWDKRENAFIYFSGIFNDRPYTEKSTFVQYESIKEYHELEDTEQFTGLTDKNGKKIYEGDIISYLNGTKSSSVYFTDGMFVHGSGECELYCSNKECEIIGTIHENPELLDER